ncbi:MAG: hypothetical protein ACE3L7_32205 [Candidatus Pristimantibacillus sp.]
MHINIQPEINVNIKLSDQEIEVLQVAADQEDKTVSQMLSEVIHKSINEYVERRYREMGLMLTKDGVYLTPLTTNVL